MPEVSLLYACIDLNSHSEHVPFMPCMSRINTKKNAAYWQFSGLDANCGACTAQIVAAVVCIVCI